MKVSAALGLSYALVLIATAVAARVTLVGAALHLCLLAAVAMAFERERAGLLRELGGAREGLERAVEARNRALANVSHEIRTPMNAILGMADLMLDGPMTPGQQGQLGTIRKAAEQLLGILTQVLDFVRPGAAAHVAHEPFDPSDCAAEVQASLAPEAERKGLALVLEVDPRTPERVFGDPGRLHQVLLNLVGNAIKFTHAGRVELRVSPSTVDGALEFEVSDTGIGVSDELRSRLFQPFVQGDASPTRLHQGAGLGLFIARTLVEGMGGQITLASGGRSGTTVTVRLPVGAAARQPAAVAVMPPAAVAEQKALVVDDNPVNLTIAAALVKKLGFAVDTATDGQGALDTLACGSYAFVLMDIQMPVLDGIEATRRLRAREPARARTPVLAVTGDVTVDIEASARGAGMDAFLPKPLARATLRTALGALVELTPRAPSARPVEAPPRAKTPAFKAIEVDVSNWPLVLVTFRGVSVDEEFAAYLAELDRVCDRGTRIAVIVDASRQAGLPYEQRRMLAEWTARNAPRLARLGAGIAYVLPSTMNRIVLGSILKLQRMPLPHRVFASLGDARVWCQAQLASPTLGAAHVATMRGPRAGVGRRLVG